MDKKIGGGSSCGFLGQNLIQVFRYSGAEVAAVCNEAALAALEENVDAQVLK